MIDDTTEFGRRVNRRLEGETIIWLTTAGGDGAPQPRPVWFLWDGETFLIYSRPEGAKLRHIMANPAVSLNMDGNGSGGDIVVFTGEATILDPPPPADQNQDYVAKYSAGFQRLGMNAAEFTKTYSAAIRVTPTGLRGH